MPTIAFWKPFDVLSKFTDNEGRATLADYIDVPDVYGAGRLDRDSEGLLLLSDNAKIRSMLTDPDHHIARTYWVQVERIPDDEAIAALRRGVEIKKHRTKPAQASRLASAPELPVRPVPIRFRKNVPDCWIELTLTEGRNRQVRRMTAAVGHPTLRLVRRSVGPITTDGLGPGEWRELTPDEEDQLRQASSRPPR